MHIDIPDIFTAGQQVRDHHGTIIGRVELVKRLWFWFAFEAIDTMIPFGMKSLPRMLVEHSMPTNG